jgi:hypothetical protein
MRVGVGSVDSHGARLPWHSDGVTLVRNADSALLPSLAHKEPLRCYDSSTDWPCRSRWTLVVGATRATCSANVSAGISISSGR